MATARIFWHGAGPQAYGGGRLPIIDEPEIAAENVTTSGTAATSGAAPQGTDVAIIRTTVDTYYRVDDGAATTDDKMITANEEREIRCKAGQTISLIE